MLFKKYGSNLFDAYKANSISTSRILWDRLKKIIYTLCEFTQNYLRNHPLLTPHAKAASRCTCVVLIPRSQMAHKFNSHSCHFDTFLAALYMQFGSIVLIESPMQIHFRGNDASVALNALFCRTCSIPPQIY